LDQDAWAQDVQGPRTLPVLLQYLEIRQMEQAIMLNSGTNDRLV
jgi:hypothetical protein